MPVRRKDTDLVIRGLSGRSCDLPPGSGLFGAHPGSRAHAPAISPGSPFLMAESLLHVWSGHVRKIMEVRTSRKKLGRARASLDSPGCHEALGRAYLAMRERSHAKHLDDLRRLRRQAWELVESLEGLPAGPRPRRPWSGGDEQAGLARSGS